MKNVTERLLQLDPTLSVHDEGEWSQKETLYKAFNDAGVECETGEFLYSMVRLLKPLNVLETGTHWGIGASYMGLGLKDNVLGHLDTIEFLPEIHLRACERIYGAVGLDGFVTAHLIDAAKFDPGEKIYDLILLDTEPQTRFAELIKYYPYLKEGGFLFIHDLHRHMHQIPNEEHGFAWPYGEIPEEMAQLVKEGKLRPFHFPTPRGLTGFYKPSSEDYVWNK